VLGRARREIGELAWQLAVEDGRRSDPADLLGRFLADWAPPVRARAVPVRHGRLTRREVEVLRLLAAGKTDAQISALLFISSKTASVHVSNIKGKLGVDTRLDAAMAARELGLAPGPDRAPDA
jgi:DNA-binding NarL/FixJ family response regulator